MVSAPIFVMLDDATLSVFGTIEDIRRDLEVIDIAAGEYAFFDAAGQALNPVVVPPDERRLMGITFTGGGELKHFSPMAGAELLARFDQLRGLNSNSLFSSLEAVAEHLRIAKPSYR